MKSTWAFGLGLLAGVVVCKNWQPLAKAGVKAGIRAGRSIKKFSDEVVEDFQDYAAEAEHALSEEAAAGQTTSQTRH